MRNYMGKVTKILLLLSCLGITLITAQVGASLPAPITSPFGWRVHPISGQWKFHAGVDLGMRQGTPIVALRRGLVVYAAPYGGYGNCIIVEDDLHNHQLYAHCSQLVAHYGQRVERYQEIAKVGSTGYSTGPHLHVEYWKNGQYANPLELWH